MSEEEELRAALGELLGKMGKSLYTAEKFREMAASERRVRENQAKTRAVEEAKRNAKIWGKPAAAAAALSGFKFKGK